MSARDLDGQDAVWLFVLGLAEAAGCDEGQVAA